MQGEGSRQVAYPSPKTKGFAPSLATVAILSLALFCKGMLTQHLDFSIEVPRNVKVQQGFCAHIPCSFSTPGWFMTFSEPLHVYWLTDADKIHTWLRPGFWIPGRVVATTNKDHSAYKNHTIKPQLKITGDPDKRDCSFSISNAGPEHVGWYYLRVETGEVDGYSYTTYRKRIHTQPHIVLLDTKKPQIEMSSEVIWGRPTTFSCVMSGMCPGMKPEITWTPESDDHFTSSWNIKESNWSSTYGVDTSFIPTLADEGKVLTCNVKYHGLKKSVHETTRLAFGYGPEATTAVGNITCQRDKEGYLCFCSFHSWPPSKIDWHMNRKLVENTTSENAAVVSWTEGNTVTSTLSWQQALGDRQHPLITCTAANKFGNYTAMVLSKPNNTSAVFSPDMEKKLKLGFGAILGILVAVVAVLITIGALFYFMVIRRRVTKVPVI